MVMQRGRWALWTRGTKPTALTKWEEWSEHMLSPTFEEVLAAFLVMKSQGQHVRMEWMPENAYGNVPQSNGQALEDEAVLAESRKWGFADKDEPTYFV